MAAPNAFLLIPVENQVRELDAKLLLACVAARRGLSSFIGSKRDVDDRIASFPRSIYIAKSLLHGHRKLFRTARQLGHEIVAWDEDSLVHLPAETYYSRRISPVSLACVSQLFAWGEDNAELWRRYPKMPPQIPIHVTGNPRNDLLRTEIQPYYQDEVDGIRRDHGEFILVNTNFNHVNSFSPIRRLFLSSAASDADPTPGRASRGMSREYAEGLRNHKQSIFEHFQEMIPALEAEFPDQTIVVRPHPVESHEVYDRIAQKCKRVRVSNKGNVVPWLMACKAVVLNGCTTSVEAYAMGVPAISYRAAVNETYDDDFYRLPNRLSHQCFDFNELCQTIRNILAGKLGAADGAERNALAVHHLAAMDGPLACERIVDVVEKMAARLPMAPKPALTDRIAGWCRANKRLVWRRSKSRDAGEHKSMEHHRKKNPAISDADLHRRLKKFQALLGAGGDIGLERMNADIFRIAG
jgi:surface carbohydrate biosynthesis protein